MSTIVYSDGGKKYHGSQGDKELGTWKATGKAMKAKYMYKGFRYYGNKKDSVVVYDKDRWSPSEFEKRKGNGFLGIKEYRV
jgi:hypothetical protein